MKKLMVILVLALFSSLAYCMANKAATAKGIGLYSRLYGKTIQMLSTPELDNVLLKLENEAKSVTLQAIKNSNNIFGQQDTLLTSTASLVKKLTDDIVQLQRDIHWNAQYLKKDMALLLTYMTRHGNLKKQKDSIKKSLNKTYVTSAKRNAQKALINFLDLLILPLDFILKSLNQLNPYI